MGELFDIPGGNRAALKPDFQKALQERKEYMKNRAIRSGNTFVVEIKDTQGQSWQGIIHWVEAQETQAFRSTLELIRLLDSAVSCDEDMGKTILEAVGCEESVT